MKFVTTLLAYAALGAFVPAFAQLAEERFDTANTHDWGVEFLTSATHFASGGNPGGHIQLTLDSASSNLPAAMIVPAAATHPWRGNFRALSVRSFSFDREVVMGSSNFGTFPFLVLGNDGGTPTDFADDTWAFTATGDSFQFGAEPWATFETIIPSTETLLPMNWDAVGLPGSPFAGSLPDDIWDEVITDVSYIGVAMGRPFGGGSWFGTHLLNLDNFVLARGSFGSNFCVHGNPNAAGLDATIRATGSNLVSTNQFVLSAENLPTNQFGIFLASSTPGFPPPVMTTNGMICLGGSIGRLDAPSQLGFSGQAGAFSSMIDLMAIPQGNSTVAINPGETWYFQAWYRDPIGLGSNLSDGLQVTFE